MEPALKLPTVKDIRAAFRQGEDAVVTLFLQQQEMFLALLAQQNQVIERQNERIRELETRLAKNSRTSSKPPSSDGIGGVSRLPDRLRVAEQGIQVIPMSVPGRADFRVLGVPLPDWLNFAGWHTLAAPPWSKRKRI